MHDPGNVRGGGNEEDGSSDVDELLHARDGHEEERAVDEPLI